MTEAGGRRVAVIGTLPAPLKQDKWRLKVPTRRQMEAMLIVSLATISAYHFARLWGQKRLAENSSGPLGTVAKAVVWS